MEHCFAIAIVTQDRCIATAIVTQGRCVATVIAKHERCVATTLGTQTFKAIIQNEHKSVEISKDQWSFLK